MPASTPLVLDRPLLRAARAGLAMVVFLLGLLAANPSAHAELHADAHASDHACAIELFAQGVTAATPELALTVLRTCTARVMLPPAMPGASRIDWQSPPSCGPPTS